MVLGRLVLGYESQTFQFLALLNVLISRGIPFLGYTGHVKFGGKDPEGEVYSCNG